MTTPPAAVTPATSPSPVRMWDLVLTVVLLVLAVGLGLLMLVMSPFLVMASDPCGSGVACNTDQMGVGFLMALIGPPVVLVVGIAAAILLLVLRRVAFWVPLVASALAIGVFVLGAAIVIGGVPGETF